MMPCMYHVLSAVGRLLSARHSANACATTLVLQLQHAVHNSLAKDASTPASNGCRMRPSGATAVWYFSDMQGVTESHQGLYLSLQQAADVNQNYPVCAVRCRLVVSDRLLYDVDGCFDTGLTGFPRWWASRQFGTSSLMMGIFTERCFRSISETRIFKSLLSSR